MGGSSGGIIVQHNAVKTLNDPIVSGSMPDWLKLTISPILEKDPIIWTMADRMVIGHALSWALVNLR